MKYMMKSFSIIALTSATLATSMAWGQGGGRGGGGGWTTSRADAQRTAWVRTDAAISVESVQKPDFRLQWTVKVGHTPRETLSEGVSGNTTQLDPQPGNVAGSGNNLYAYEIDTGAIAWTKHFDVPASAAATEACPGGLTGGVTRATSLIPNVAGTILGGRGAAGGAGRGATGGVGAPGEGVPAAMVVRAGRGGRGASGVGVVAFAAVGAPAASGRVGLRGEPAESYVLASDGVLHAVGQAQGKELKKPIPFLPANANATELTAVGQTVYTSATNNCGGVANGVWALDLANPYPFPEWKSGASPVGEIAFSSAGTLYVAIGDGAAGANGYADAIVALDPKTLMPKDWFTMPGASFSSTPVIFMQGGRELVAAATKDGRVFLLDAASLGGADHKTALASSAATTTSKTWSPSALATWEDAAQTRWILLPTVGASNGIAAFKVAGTSLQPAWTSTIASPSAPIVVNGVVFALNNGSATSPAVLYALDGTNGKEIWNSGKTIKSFVKSAGLWSISGQVYVATNDAMIYAFGTPMGR
jgi:hypothetical protein